MSIKDNIKKLKDEIPSYVKILAATKTRSIFQIKEAINSGIKIFGENYVQEAEKKYKNIKNNKIELYFIGHLQKNKINRALKLFDLLTIDSFELAAAIDKRANEKNKFFSSIKSTKYFLYNKKIPVLIEVNISNEPNKQGCKPQELIGLIKKISKLKNIEIQGLIAMAPYFEDEEKTRPYFKKMKSLFNKIKKLKIKSIKMDILSLGMSNDYKIAIQEGSNLIRIGSLIFG